MKDGGSAFCKRSSPQNGTLKFNGFRCRRMPAGGSATYSWTKPLEGLGGFSPPPRTNHTLTLLPREFGSALILFGGRTEAGVHPNDILRLDVGDTTPPRQGTWNWSLIPVAPSSEEIAEGREGHTAAVFRDELVVFGGLGADGLLNKVSTFGLDTLKWSHPPVSGMPPIRRHQHSAVLFGNNYVVFGGFSEYGDCENDVAVLDLPTWRWSSPAIDGSPPAPRMAHSAARFGSNMVVYGGFALADDHGDNPYLSDVFVLDTERWTWTHPQIQSAVPNILQRAGHAVASHGSELFVLGGHCAVSLLDCDLWILDTNSWTWSKPSLVQMHPGGACHGLNGHTVVLFGAPGMSGHPFDTSHLSRPRLIVWGGAPNAEIRADKDTAPAVSAVQGGAVAGLGKNLKRWGAGAGTPIFNLEVSELPVPAQPDESLPQLDALGAPLVARPDLPVPRNWQMIDTELKLPRRARIVQWQLHAKKPGTIRLQVYRSVPREGAAKAMKRPYRLVGENVVTVEGEGEQHVHINDKEQITAEDGDVVGVRVDSDLAVQGGDWPHNLADGMRTDSQGNGATPSAVVAMEYGSAENPSDPQPAPTGHVCHFCIRHYQGIGGVYDFDDGGAVSALNAPITIHRTLSLRLTYIPLPDKKKRLEEVADEERESELLYLLADHTLAQIPRGALEDLRQQRLLNPQPTPTATGGRRTRTGNKSMDGSLSPIKPPDSPTRRTLQTPSHLELSDAPKSPLPRAAKEQAGKKGKETPSKLVQGVGAKAPFKTPVLDGRRLPEGERLPKELEARERAGGKPGGAGGQIPMPTFAGDGEGEEEEESEGED